MSTTWGTLSLNYFFLTKILIVLHNSTIFDIQIYYNIIGDVMEKIIISMILIVFPILMYLVFCCYNSLNNKKLADITFIITILTSLYLSFTYDLTDIHLLLFCNIPVLVCYFKKEGLLGIILSIIVVMVSYFKYDVNIYIVSLKYLSYLVTYLLLVKRKEFNYLFLKISAIIQGLFISFEYFMRTYDGVEYIINLFIYILIVYVLTFFMLYLFKSANNVSSLYSIVNNMNEESKIKDSLFKLTHEIKNPIAVCKGYLDMINLDNMDKSKKYLNIIKSEIDRSLNVIADFMEYSKIKINKEIIDMELLIEEIYESYTLLLRDNRINLNYQPKYDEVYLWGDYDRLKQVFVNVIKNSIESIDKDGIIDIDMVIKGEKVIITISDNGIGMTKEELKDMKTMFYTTKKNGTGLGVALSNEIILAHNGKMEYESIKNVGTKCIITLPV